MIATDAPDTPTIRNSRNEPVPGEFAEPTPTPSASPQPSEEPSPTGSKVRRPSTWVAGRSRAIVVALLNLGVLPGLTGLTLGKWATGLRIERNDGGPVGIGRALLRHFVGYPLSFALLGIGFLIAAVSVHGRGLHDMIAGTIVVREGSI